MYPLDLVSAQEKEAIECHINNNAENSLQVTIDYILREWNEQKVPLFNTIFNGDKLILEKEVTFERSKSSILIDFENEWHDMPEEAHDFVDAFLSFCVQKRHECWGHMNRFLCSDAEYSINSEKESHWYRCERLISNTTLANNAVEEDFAIPLPKEDGTVRLYKVQEKSKPMRVLGKIRKAYGFGTEEGYRAFSVWHSQMLNDKCVRGTFCLSIHPLDYITMSENANNWSSCMSWEENGCYRSGTVEMMNSPMVIVAYLKSNECNLTMPCGYNSSTRHFETLDWNSKKWRTLIVVNDTGIYSVKSYPYYHKEMTQYAMKWIASLRDEDYEAPIKFRPYNDTIVKYKDMAIRIEVNPHTYRMYNDFGSTSHYMMLKTDILEEMYQRDYDDKDIEFTYSGASECMSCGALAYPNSRSDITFDNEEYLVCDNCNENISTYECEECGCTLYDEDSIWWVNDIPLCEDCYRRLCFEDAWTGESGFLDEDNPVDLIILDGKEKIHIGKVMFENIYCWVNDKEFFNSLCLKKADLKNKELTIDINLLNERGRSHFNHTRQAREFKLLYA